MIKLITHNDLDGIGCYVVLDRLTTLSIDVEYVGYDSVNDAVLNALRCERIYSHIYITDISVSLETALELEKIKHKVTLLDHHKTALELNKFEWATVVEECSLGKTCGTYLLYKHLKEDADTLIQCSNSSLANFVELVRKYDTWEWYNKYKQIEPKDLNDLFRLYGKKEFFLDMTYKIISNKPFFNQTDKALLKVRQTEIDNYIEKKNKSIRIRDFKGYKVGLVFAENYLSELGNRLCYLNPKLDFIAMITDKSISFRTDKDDVDVSEIAKLFGGGGHAKSSGCKLDKSLFDNFIDNILGGHHG